MTQAVELNHAETRIQPATEAVNPWEIASFLSSQAAQALTIRVWQQDCLCILLESKTVLDRADTIRWLRQQLAALKLEQLKSVRIYARSVGQFLPTWREELQLQSEDVDLNALKLFNWLQQGSTTPPPTQPSSTLGEDEVRLLRFRITAETTALLPLNDIQKVLKISPEAILSVPQVPDCVLGVYNYRSEILWLVDLGKQLEFSPFVVHSSALLTAIVLQHNNQLLGLVVPDVMNIEAHPVQQQQPPIANLFPASVYPFLQGYLLSSGLPILSASALIHHFSTTASFYSRRQFS